MCVGNRAPNASYYINKQVQTLWELSKECVARHGVGVKTTRAEIEYGSALAQICVGKQRSINPSVKDLTFFAFFGAAPQINFICNHELLLTLSIKSGHYRSEGKASVEEFGDYTCAFRVPFHYHDITDRSYADDGHGVYRTQVMILDLNDAVCIRQFSSFKIGHTFTAEQVNTYHDNITRHIKMYYFPLLRKAGYHCLHSLPNFDNLSRPNLLIDYSLVSSVEIETLEIFGFSIQSINSYLTDRWLEATAIIDAMEGDGYRNDASLMAKCVLAEHQGSFDDIYFQAFFGPPQLRVRCSKEVIFTIDAQDLLFYMDGGFDSKTVHKVSGWKIVLIVDAYLVEEEGGVRRLRLDFSKCRFSQSHSVTVSEIIETSILTSLIHVFVTYITKTYVTILEENDCHYVYIVDDSITDTVETDIDLYTDDDLIEFKDKLTITQTYDFDMITTISQGSLNDHFRSLWRASRAVNGCFSSWAYESYFDAAFGPLRVQFPADTRSRTVIVYVHLSEGFLTTMSRDKKIVEGNKWEFSNWRLAFDVDIRLKDTSKTHGILDSHFGNKPTGEWVFKQLVLDFSTAKVRYDLSKLSGILENFNSYAARSKCAALLYYISRFYFAQLTAEGHNLLYTFPLSMSSGGTGSSIVFAPTSFDFQFLPAPSDNGQFVSSLFGYNRNFGDRNMLVICGMLNGQKPPSFPLPSTSWTWTVSDERFSGMFSLSSKTFLQGWLLNELAGINQRTTLVPVFHGIGNDGAWDMDLVAWCEHPIMKNKPSYWNKTGPTSQGGLEYQWKYKDNWTYTHEGNVSHIYNGGYTVSCTTSNSLVLPTVNRRGICEIKIKGQVDLKLSFSGGAKSWSTSATAEWTASIIISTVPHCGGLKISSTSSRHLPKPTGFKGNTELVTSGFKEASAFLQHHFSDSKVVLVEENTINTLEGAFTGVWPLCQTNSYGFALANPVFNTQGDLLLELVAPVDSRGTIVVSDASKYGLRLPGSSQTKSQYQSITKTTTTTAASIFSQLTTSINVSETLNGIQGLSASLSHFGINGSAKATTKDIPKDSLEFTDVNLSKRMFQTGGLEAVTLLSDEQQEISSVNVSEGMIPEGVTA